MDRRDLLKAAGGTLLVATSGVGAFHLLAGTRDPPPPGKKKKWGMVIDLKKCQAYSEQCKEKTGKDCTDCIEACREENNVARYKDEDKTVRIRWIRKVMIREKPETEANEESNADERPVILLCNHCDKPPCAQVCPVQATYKRDDGIVIVDHHRCIGCRYCMIACPYNARQFNFVDGEWLDKEHSKTRPKRSHGVAESCTLCAHRLDVVGKDGKHGVPACVEKCKAGALVVGDMKKDDSDVSKLIAERAVKRLKEDLGTEPKVHYIGL